MRIILQKSFLCFALATGLWPELGLANDNSSESCWSRRVWANGQAFNPNKFAAQSNARSDYLRNVRTYKGKCEATEACQLYAPRPSIANCTPIGSNWQCRISEEIRCLKNTEAE